VLPPPGPEPGASTNSAISARAMILKETAVLSNGLLHGRCNA
jgi:hypothetical protein